ncbi:hypothetical protein BDK51DRAFT_44969 [Blyttiomyces helicus]|uniref:Galactose oxidase n=1 Tax=Blyttiomyces helicus TaxID=388810 RepID=A0A4P9WGC9_9FUNG|nr:hypothetical protein BDK51DRAFT_44969 [Blyttiomyces helicus]|eukprot:RKO91754.1 hypothetical protein BDK51DRAFT_44969 [Blyttiomyces helicus]
MITAEQPHIGADSGYHFLNQLKRTSIAWSTSAESLQQPAIVLIPSNPRHIPIIPETTRTTPESAVSHENPTIPLPSPPSVLLTLLDGCPATRFAQRSPALASCGPDAVYLVSDQTRGPGPNIWHFGTVTGEWTLLVPTTPASYNPNVAVYGPRSLTYLNNTLFAGLPDGSFSRFDLATPSWSTLPTPLAPLFSVAPVVLHSSVRYIGAFSGSTESNLAQILDSTTQRWTTGTPYPRSVNSAGSAVIADTAYVFGGFARGLL